MPLLSNMERRGIQKTLRKSIINLLQKRFVTLPNELVESINNLEDIPRLEQLNLETISVNSVEEFQKLIFQPQEQDSHPNLSNN